MVELKHAEPLTPSSDFMKFFWISENGLQFFLKHWQCKQVSLTKAHA